MKKLFIALVALGLSTSAHAFDETVTVTWSDPGTEDSFELEKSASTCISVQVWSPLAQPAANVLSYTDTVQDDATYCYRVRAVKNGQFGPWSQGAEVVIPASLAPITATATQN